MRFERLQYSNGQMNKAAQKLITWRADEGDEVFNSAFDKVYALRLAYAYPLRAVTVILRKRALAVDPNATVYSRAKRVRSVMDKLRRIPTMKLTTMQDLAGCRAVVSDIVAVFRLADQFRDIQHRLDGPEEYDYILEPKPDGYRSVHFVVKFTSRNRAYKEISGRRVEIQLRSRLQHQWATAVETVDLFTGQTLKAGGGGSSWRRFFLLAADLLAIEEGCPRVAGSSGDRNDLEKELRDWWDWLAIETILSGWLTVVYRDIPLDPGENYNYLIETDVENRTTSVRSFSPEQLNQAYSEYAAAEIRNMESIGRTAVLVSASSVNQLRQAFLGYYGDTSGFINTMKGELGIVE